MADNPGKGLVMGMVVGVVAALFLQSVAWGSPAGEAAWRVPESVWGPLVLMGMLGARRWWAKRTN